MHHVTFHSLFLEVVSMIILSVSEPKLKDQLSLVATPIKLTQHLFRCLWWAFEGGIKLSLQPKDLKKPLGPASSIHVSLSVTGFAASTRTFEMLRHRHVTQTATQTDSVLTLS